MSDQSFLIQSVLADPKMGYYEAVECGVTGDTFANLDARLIWEAICNSMQASHHADRYSILTLLKKDGHKSAMKALDSIPAGGAKSVRIHAGVLRDQEKARKLKALLASASRISDTDDACQHLAVELMNIQRANESHRIKTFSEISEQVIAKVNAYGTPEDRTGRDSWCEQVNQWAIPYKTNRPTFIGGYRGTGKSVLCKQEILFQAKKGPVGVISLEDSAEEVAVSATSIDGAGFMWRFEKGWGDAAMFKEKWAKVNGLPIYISDARQDIEQLCTTITLLKVQYDCDFILVDHLHHIKKARDLRSLHGNDLFEHYCERLCDTQKQLGISLVVFAQLSRECEKESRPPRLSDLRSSGSIEQVGGRVYLLYRDASRDDVDKRSGTITNKSTVHILEGAKIGVSGQGGERKAYLDYNPKCDGFIEIEE